MRDGVHTIYAGIRVPGKPDPSNIQRLDLLPLPMLQRMMRVGIAIDREWMWELTSKLEGMAAELEKDICAYIPLERLEEFASASAGDDEDSEDLPINVNSAEQIGHLLFSILGIGAGKELKRTKSGTRISTGKKQMETLKRDHPVIPLVLKHRECRKLVTTYTKPLPLKAKLHKRGDCYLCGLRHSVDHWRVHGEMTYTRAATGRFQMKKPNLYNIPARTELGREVRMGFIPTPDPDRPKKMLSRDMAQIELRILADRACERNMIRIFTDGGDIHADTAMRAFSKTLEEVSKGDGKLLYRAPCKNINFAVLYQISALGLYDLMAVTFATAGLPLPDWCDLDWCEKFILRWFELYPDAYEYFELQKYRMRRYECVWDMFGGTRRTPEVRSVHKRVVAAGFRQGINTPIQGGNARMLKIAMGMVHGQLEELRGGVGVHVEPLVPVYDELLCEADEEWAEATLEILGVAMETVMNDETTGERLFRVPIKSDGKTMPRWQKD